MDKLFDPRVLFGWLLAISVGLGVYAYQGDRRSIASEVSYALNMVDALTLMAKDTSDNQILIERSLAVLAQIANDLDEDVKNNAQAIIQMRGQIP